MKQSDHYKRWCKLFSQLNRPMYRDRRHKQNTSAERCTMRLHRLSTFNLIIPGLNRRLYLIISNLITFANFDPCISRWYYPPLCTTIGEEDTVYNSVHAFSIEISIYISAVKQSRFIKYNSCHKNKIIVFRSQSIFLY